MGTGSIGSYHQFCHSDFVVCGRLGDQTWEGANQQIQATAVTANVWAERKPPEKAIVPKVIAAQMDSLQMIETVAKGTMELNRDFMAWHRGNKAALQVLENQVSQKKV